MKLFKSKNLLFAAVITLLGATMLTGCTATDKTEPQEQSANQGPVKTIPHIWGETEIQGTPTKVITLDFSFVDELTALGVAPVGMAGTGALRVPEYLADRVKEYTYVGERKEPNLELIRSANPDLIIANPDRHKMIKNELQDIAPTVALDDTSYSEVLKNTELLGDLLGKKAEAEQVKKDLEAKIQNAKQKIQGSPKVLVVGAFEDEFSVWVKDSFIGTLMSDVGTTYAFTGSKGTTSEGKSEVAKLTMERLAEINPDFLFVYGDLNLWKDNPLFKNLKAVKEGKVIEVDRNIWSRGRGPIAASLILDQGLPILTGTKK